MLAYNSPWHAWWNNWWMGWLLSCKDIHSVGQQHANSRIMVITASCKCLWKKWILGQQLSLHCETNFMTLNYHNSGVGTGGATGPPNNSTEGAWPPQNLAIIYYVLFNVNVELYTSMIIHNKDSFPINFFPINGHLCLSSDFCGRFIQCHVAT